VRCVNEKRKRLRWQAANHGCQLATASTEHSYPIGWRLRLLRENFTQQTHGMLGRLEAVATMIGWLAVFV